MKFLIFAVLLAVTLSFVTSDRASDDDHKFWQEYKKAHRKNYLPHEESLRKELLLKHKAFVNLHNQKFHKGEVPYTIGVNEFSDMTDEEKSSRFGARFDTAQPARRKRTIGTQPMAFNASSPYFYSFSADSSFALPSSVDLRTTGWTEAVRNQGSCGSCWAFSTSSMMGYYQYNKTKTNQVFAPQNLVDCAYIWGAAKCNGASPAQALEYIMKQKQTTESSYPYKGVNGTCSVPSTAPLYTINGFLQIKNDMASLKQAVAQLGAVVISINANNVMSYTGGIWDGTDPKTGAACSSSPNHAVTLIGYGTDATTKKAFWLIKNSWGPTWGESGYFRMAMTSTNLCGIYTFNYAIRP